MVAYGLCLTANIHQRQNYRTTPAKPTMADIALGKAMGWGLIRTETLADSSERCDFRFKKGGELRISSKTTDVQATIERIREKEARKNS
ncbi:MAG: hypothetical protein KKF26_02975 [Chloroflexi bacterium]|nr:hypothetical protein [Chloroflexota bacterium]